MNSQQSTVNSQLEFTIPLKRGFVMTPRHQPLEEETRELIDRLLLEKISLAGIEAGDGGFTKVATILC